MPTTRAPVPPSTFQLLTQFPRPPQAAKVEPAVSDKLDAYSGHLKGTDPCPVVDSLHVLRAQAAELPGDAAGVSGAHKPEDGTAGGTDTAPVKPGCTYTECAYVVENYTSGYSS